ncbi:type II secretion system protein N [Parvularcula dongshanensis]|uniref:General secretion pathway protein C n=1 Tax=Parvularcula dongshanensis TaxID=1173995 RepID=A0A840HXR2_9PROT|nr:type II secretion system protein N [Parvularcula dongshanensis]MBB4657626.1 general secretion pathway protein C [Parvularcula dongshanensis]
MAQTATQTGQTLRPGPRAPRPGRSGRGKPVAARLVEFAYVALVGILLVRVVHALIAPIEPPASATEVATRARFDADLGILSRTDPFGGKAAAPATTTDAYAGAAETTLDLELKGTSGGGGIATVIIEMPDGRQRAFALGDEIMRGVTLKDVRPPNQVILNRSGVNETLTIEGREGGSAASNAASTPRPQAAEGPRSPSEALAALTQAFQFRPIDGSSGFSVHPGPKPGLFTESGFAEGDIVTSVDGIPAPSNPAQLLELMADLPPSRPFIVTVERQGLPLDVPVDLSRAFAP